MKSSMDILNDSLKFLDSMNEERFQEYVKELNLEPLDMSIYDNDNGIEIISYAENNDEFDFSIDVLIDDFANTKISNNISDEYMVGCSVFIPAA